MREFGDELYDSDNVNTRNQINLAKFPPVFDDDGREIPIYTPHGVPIPRLAAIMPETGPSYCALLPHLPSCRSLFTPDFDDDDDDDMEVEDALDDSGSIQDEDERGTPAPRRRPPPRDIAFQVYPTAFTHTLGNWQAKGIITTLAKHVKTINASVSRFPIHAPAIEGSISQCYNNFSHHTRRSAGQHIVQRGILTGVTAGAWATNASANRTANKLFSHVAFDLPHHALAMQVLQVKETALRFENVFTIHINRLSPPCLNGSQFFDLVIEPLIEACAKPDVFEALRASTTVLKPGVRFCPHSGIP